MICQLSFECDWVFLWRKSTILYGLSINFIYLWSLVCASFATFVHRALWGCVTDPNVFAFTIPRAVLWYQDGESVQTAKRARTWTKRIFVGEIVWMLLTERLAWENTEQELLVCNAINLIYELRALISRTDWQHCEDEPTFLCECERRLTCFDSGAVSQN